MKICKIKKCSKKSIAKELCPMHYARFKGYNKVPLKSPSRRPHYGQGCLIDKDGYKQINVNGKYRREHRVIMENHINRKLESNEAVHHINGNKLDNCIENLQILSFSEHKKIHGLITVELRKKAVDLYLQGMSATKIPQHVNICYSEVYKSLIFAGIQIRGASNRNIKSNVKHAIYRKDLQ